MCVKWAVKRHQKKPPGNAVCVPHAVRHSILCHSSQQESLNNTEYSACTSVQPHFQQPAFLRFQQPLKEIWKQMAFPYRASCVCSGRSPNQGPLCTGKSIPIPPSAKCSRHTAAPNAACAAQRDARISGKTPLPRAPLRVAEAALKAAEQNTQRCSQHRQLSLYTASWILEAPALQPCETSYPGLVNTHTEPDVIQIYFAARESGGKEEHQGRQCCFPFALSGKTS